MRIVETTGAPVGLPFARLSGPGRSTQAGATTLGDTPARRAGPCMPRVVAAGTVMSGPVMHDRSVGMDGDPPSGLQGSPAVHAGRLDDHPDLKSDGMPMQGPRRKCRRPATAGELRKSRFEIRDSRFETRDSTFKARDSKFEMENTFIFN